MQGVQSTTRISPPTKAVSKKAPSPKASKENEVVHKAKLPSSGSKLSNPGPHQCSYIESNVPRKKRVISEHIQGVTDLKILPTPINLYEDECAFCHSFRTTTTFHGPMVRYRMGRIVSSDEGSPSNVICVHMKCLDWAPQVWFEGDTVMNLEPEIRRASRLRCHRCGISGAALGCYYEHCNKSFHVPCAVQIYDCRWDVDGGYVLCPEHVSKVLPCDNLSSQTKERQKLSSLPQRQFSHKEESFESFEGEGQQIHQLNTGNFFLPLSQYSVKVENFDGYDEEDQQTDHLNASNSSSFPQSQSSQKEAFSTHSSREGKKIDQHTASSSSLQMSCCADEEGISNACQSEDMKTDLQQTSSYPSDKLVLLGSLLSASEKDSLEDFACWTKATVTNEWGENVTHVIVGKYAGSTWSRSYEALMAILFGKWVVQTQWFVNCLGMRPDREDSYEVTCSDDSDRPLDGPKKGRTRAAEGAPKLFSGLHFCLSECMSPGDSGRLRKLIAAAGGRVLEPSSSLQWRSLRGHSSPRPYFVFNGSAPEEFRASSLRMEVKEAMEHKAAGARVVGHLTVLHAVAAYDADVLDRKGRLCA